MEKENLRFYIRIRTLLGIKAVEIHNELNLALGDGTISYMCVLNWVTKFKNGLEDVKDQHRIGRPITETNKSNIERVKSIIEQDPFSTYDDIEALTSLSRGTIQTIISDHLKLRKLVFNSS